jgi:hypothetical protein
LRRLSRRLGRLRAAPVGVGLHALMISDSAITSANRAYVRFIVLLHGIYEFVPMRLPQACYLGQFKTGPSTD